MNLKEDLKTAVLMTAVTTILLGLIYPLAITGAAQLLFHDKANGQLIERGGKIIGSRIIGQPFTGPGYFHSRPSAAGNGYDPMASGGSNLGPTNARLVQRVAADVATLQSENPDAHVPIDLVTTSGSGLDSDITPAAAVFQIPRVARERGTGEDELRKLVSKHTRARQMGVFGEPRVSVFEVNLELDQVHPLR